MGESELVAQRTTISRGGERAQISAWSEGGLAVTAAAVRARQRQYRVGQAASLLLQGYAPGRVLAAVGAVARAAGRRFNIMVRFVVLQLALRACGRGLLDSAVGRRVTIDLVTTIALRAGLLCGELRLHNWGPRESQHGRERYEFG